MANDSVRATGAALRDVDNRSPSAQQDCSDVVHISVFFDGTGNNKDVDEAKKKWSNVARIWRSARMFSDANINAYPVYVSGVGTPFNGKPLFGGEEKIIAIEDSEWFGAAGGAGGTRRLNFGQQQVNDALRSALLSRAKTLGGQVARYADAGKQQSFADVHKALGEHRLIKQINISIYGFSRGAALARAFCNQWLWQCKESRGQLSYESYPIRFVFLGLFDTVASFGLPATNTANTFQYGGFKGRDLVVDTRVERCVHYVAAHELRFSFPVDLIRRDGALVGNWLEKTYPGVHSDIGGGYEPREQGIDDNYARIPMRDMMREAQLHGSRILGYEALSKNSAYKALFQERFECKPETESAFKAYAAICSPSGTIEQQMQKHMAQLYSAHGTLHRNGGESVTQRVHREGASWSRLAPADMAKELENYHRATQALSSPAKLAMRTAVNPTYALRKGGYALWISPKHWQLEAWNQKADAGVMNFIHTYVHDSKAGFLNNAEPFSYFSKRGVSESSRSVQGWFEDNVARPAGQAFEATVDAASRGVEKGAQVAKKAQEAAVEKAQQAKELAVETANQVQQATVEAGRKVQQAAQSSADALSRGTQEAISIVKQAWNYLY